MLLFARIIYPGSKRSSLELSRKFLEKPDCKLHHIYRALEILAKENDFFQSQLYKNSELVLNRQKRVLYYDCTNYYFEIEEADDFRKYGHSKENRPNPIVQMPDYHQLQTVSSTTLRTGNLLQRKQSKSLKDTSRITVLMKTDGTLSEIKKSTSSVN